MQEEYRGIISSLPIPPSAYPFVDIVQNYSRQEPRWLEMDNQTALAGRIRLLCDGLVKEMGPIVSRLGEERCSRRKVSVSTWRSSLDS